MLVLVPGLGVIAERGQYRLCQLHRGCFGSGERRLGLELKPVNQKYTGFNSKYVRVSQSKLYFLNPVFVKFTRQTIAKC